MLASRHQASPYSLERQAAAERWGEYLKASDTAAAPLIHLEQRSQTTAQLKRHDVHNSAASSHTVTSIPASLPVKQTCGASLTKADSNTWGHRMKPLPLYSDIGDNLAELHPSHHDNSFIWRRNVYIQYIPPITPLNLIFWVRILLMFYAYNWQTRLRGSLYENEG